MKIAIQMDWLETVDVTKDSSYLMALESQKRGYETWHYHPTDLFWQVDKLLARCSKLNITDEAMHIISSEIIAVADFDVILMRQDPPVDMQYYTASMMLEAVPVLVVNDPRGVRDSPEKLVMTNFPDIAPATLIAHNSAEVLNFRERYEDIIIKPLYGNGGAGVFHIPPDDENLQTLLESFALMYPRQPMIIQEYMPEVKEGDRRILLIDGEPIGAINRVPPKGQVRSNMHIGGKPTPYSITQSDKKICSRIAPLLKERGLLFAGIDIIGDKLTEINVTSPTGMQEVNRFDGINCEAIFWNAVEKKYNAR